MNVKVGISRTSLLKLLAFHVQKDTHRTAQDKFLATNVKEEQKDAVWLLSCVSIVEKVRISQILERIRVLFVRKAMLRITFHRIIVTVAYLESTVVPLQVKIVRFVKMVQ